MPKIILDGYTNAKVSPQRRRQLRLVAKGLCRSCAKPLVPGLTQCAGCVEKALKRRLCRKVEAGQSNATP